MTTLVVEHAAATGTILSGTSRGDGVGDAVRALGWRWGRALGAWFVPRTRDTAPPRELIEQTRVVLTAAGFTVQVRIDDTVPDPGAYWARVAVHEEARAVTLTRRADQHEQCAAEHAAARDALAVLVPFGQPLLVDSAGYAGQLRLRKTMDRHEREETKHRHAAHQLRAAARRAHHADTNRCNPAAVANRIARLEPELRRIRARIATAVQVGDDASMAWLVDREQMLAGGLAYWAAMHAEQVAAAVIIDHGPDQVYPGDQVQIGAHWWPVVRTSNSSVTVLMDPATSRTNRTPWRNVRAVRTVPGTRRPSSSANGHTAREEPSQSVDGVQRPRQR